MTIAPRTRALTSASAAMLAVVACGGAPCPAPATVEAVAAVETDTGTETREVDRLADAATAALVAGRRADAAVLLTALATLDPERAVSLGLYALGAEPLPIVAPLADRFFVRSLDRTTVVHRVVSATSEGVECPDIVLRHYDLERGERTTIRVPHGASSERLAPLLALDAIAEGISLATRSRECGAPRYPVERDTATGSTGETMYDFECGRVRGFLAPSAESCGQLERVSPRGGFAVVTSLVADPASDDCRPPGRPVRPSGAAPLCIAPVARLVDLGSGDARVLGVLRYAAFSPDERWLLVRTADGARIEAVDGVGAPRALSPECTGAEAFSADGSGLAVVCGDHVEVLDLEDRGRRIPSVSLETALGAAHAGLALGLGVSAHGSRTVIVLGTEDGAHLAIVDEAGVVTHRVGPGEIAGSRRLAEVASPTVEPAAHAVPRIRTGGELSFPGERAWRGGYLEVAAPTRAYFVDDCLFVIDTIEGHPSELWVPGREARARRARPTWTLARTLEPVPGALVGEAETGEGDRVLSFEAGTYSFDGRFVAAASPDHPLGPSRWHERAGDIEAADPRAVAREIGARTNLRACEDLRVVPVFPMPPADEVWAPAAACAASDEAPERSVEAIDCSYRI